jgi:chaperonin GroES
MPDSAKEKPQEGSVVAVGLGHLSDTGSRTPVQCCVGDHVFFGKFAGTEITVNGQKLLLLREAELLGSLFDPQSITDDDIPY